MILLLLFKLPEINTKINIDYLCFITLVREYPQPCFSVLGSGQDFLFRLIKQRFEQDSRSVSFFSCRRQTSGKISCAVFGKMECTIMRSHDTKSCKYSCMIYQY